MIEPSILRILNAKGRTIGTGFLVSKTLAMTCAHVAMSASPDGENRIRVQFAKQKQPIYARVRDDFLDIDLDVAILELESVPNGVMPLQLGLAAQCQSGDPFYSFGYTTAANIQGIIARGTIDGYLPQHRLLQLQAPQANHGISGAPVLDEKLGVVVGMIAKGHTELGRNQETTFAIPSELLFEVCHEIRPIGICPYLGLESFTDETARFFFGREALTERLIDALRGGCRFLAVFGPSGSGKSSVVRAGLLPALAKGRLSGSQKWTQVIMRPGDDPFAQTNAALESPDTLPPQYLKGRVVLFIDQFEELFTLCSDETRERFVRELAKSLENSRLVLIISMRDDFYSAFNAKAAPLAGWVGKTVVDVPAILERADLVAMIERPAEAAGLALEENLTKLILKDATTDGAVHSATLPLLEFALTQLWDKRQGSMLTHAAYQSIDGVTGSLTRWADETYFDLSKEDQALAEGLLTALVHLGDETQGLPDTRRRRALAEFDEPTRRVIKHFADRRLLVTGGKTVELVHDMLVREWGQLQGWIKHDHRNLQLRQAVSDAAYQWETGGKDADLLNHRGARLEQAVVMSTKLRFSLNEVERAYLDACMKAQAPRTSVRAARIRMLMSAAGALIVLAMWASIAFLGFQLQGVLGAPTPTAQIITSTPVPTLVPTATIVPGKARVDEVHGSGGNVKFDQYLDPGAEISASSEGVKVVVGEQSNITGGQNTAGVMYWFGDSTGNVNFDVKHMMPVLEGGALYIQPGNSKAEVHFAQQPNIIAAVEGSRMIVELAGNDIWVYCFEGKCRLDPEAYSDELKIEVGSKRLYRTALAKADAPIVMTYDEKWAWNLKCNYCLMEIVATPTPTQEPIINIEPAQSKPTRRPEPTAQLQSTPTKSKK